MAVTQSQIDALQAAYDALISGQAAAEVRDSNGETVRYVKADLNRLQARITAMQNELDGTTPSYPMRTLM